jgi:hypothetical protein
VELGKSENSFSSLSEGEVDGLELLGGFIIDGLVSSVNKEVGAEGPELFGGSLDVHTVVGVVGFPVDNTEGVLVGGVEGHLSWGAIGQLDE